MALIGCLHSLRILGRGHLAIVRFDYSLLVGHTACIELLLLSLLDAVSRVCVAVLYPLQLEIAKRSALSACLRRLSRLLFRGDRGTIIDRNVGPVLHRLLQRFNAVHRDSVVIDLIEKLFQLGSRRCTCGSAIFSRSRLLSASFEAECFRSFALRCVSVSANCEPTRVLGVRTM